MYDAIVVGARCAGASTAMLLARQGHKVLLVDRATFPSDIPQGHYIHHGGPALLARWGLLDAVLATGTPPITRLTTEWHGVRLTGENVAMNGVPAGLAPRRSALDGLLVEAAVAAGAELRASFTVDEFTTDGDHRISGIRGHERGGSRRVAERARITIGADGRYSALARFVDAPFREASPTLTCFYFSYWSGLGDNGAEVYDLGDKVIFAVPTNDHLTAIFASWPIFRASAIRVDIEGHFMEAIDQVPDLAERVRNGRREEPFRGAIDLPNFLRKPYGEGWALVGDAGCHKDPYLALGCGDAFRDAAFLAESLHSGLSGDRHLDDALADYEQRRNQTTMPDYQRNLHLAQFRGLPPEQRGLRLALQGNEQATREMYLAFEQLTPAEQFFNPENLRRLIGDSAVTVSATSQGQQAIHRHRFAPGSGIHGRRRPSNHSSIHAA